MVGIAPVRRLRASRMDAALVADRQCAPYCRRNRPCDAADVERFAVGAQHDGNDGCVAGKSAGVSGGDGLVVQCRGQLGPVHRHGQMRFLATLRGKLPGVEVAAAQFDQSVRPAPGRRAVVLGLRCGYRVDRGPRYRSTFDIQSSVHEVASAGVPDER